MKKLFLFLLTILLLFALDLKATQSVQGSAGSPRNSPTGVQVTATPVPTTNSSEGPGLRGTISAVIAFLVVIGLLVATRMVSKPKDP